MAPLYYIGSSMHAPTHKLEHQLDRLHPLQGPARPAFLAAWQYWSCHRDHYLLREHVVSDYIYFVEQGSLRIFYRKQQKEITEWLAMEEQFCLSITSFFQRQPSRLMIQTLEPGVVWGIHYRQLMQLADEYHEVERLLRKLVTASLILSQVRMESIQFETAQQRYQRLLQAAPDIINRVPVNYIASFLGVSRETLSRIRSQQAATF
jgi:CRP-like cAMP-binding protein